MCLSVSVTGADSSRESTRSRTDPTRPGQARNETITLKYHPDFLLYQATVSGSAALRHVMIPCLIDSLRELTPSDCMTQACLKSNKRISRELERLDPHNQCGQLPKYESTLKKKLCIGKFNPAFHRYYQDDDSSDDTSDSDSVTSSL